MVDLAAEARLFRTRLNSAKKAIAPDFEWYPYDSLSNVSHLTQLLGASSEDVWQAAAEGEPHWPKDQHRQEDLYRPKMRHTISVSNLWLAAANP